MKFSLDILWVILKDFLVAQNETEIAEKIGALVESDVKELLEIRKSIKFSEMLKCFFKSNPNLKKLINKKSEQILAKISQKEDEGSDTEEEEVEEVKPKEKKVNGKKAVTNGKIKTVINEEIDEEDNQLLGQKTERKPFQRIDESLNDKLPEQLKNNSYDHFSRNYGDEFGKPANDKLKNNKGKDFRKEKTKFKNKMSFGGQKLSTEVRSVRLDQDE